MNSHIFLAKNLPIKNGTLLVQCKNTGLSNQDVYNYYAKITSKTQIDKYNNRFDDTTYYYGDDISTLSPPSPTTSTTTPIRLP